MRRWLETTFAALVLGPFRRLWAGTLLAFLGFFMSTVVQSVVAFDLAGTNRAVGWVVFAQGLAMLALGPLGGALADRWPKKWVVVGGQVVPAAVFLGLGALVAARAIRVGHLAAGSLLMGATFAFLGPARQALVVEVVPARHRGNALALSMVAHSASRVLGPALAGALLASALFGAAGAYATMGTLYVVSGAIFLGLPPSHRRRDERPIPVLEDVREGLRYAWERRRLRLLILFFVSVVMVGFPYVTVLPGFVEHALGREARDVSLFYMAAAVGALSASLAVARHADSPRALGLYSGLALAFAVGLAALAVAPSFASAVAAMLLVGAGSGGFQSLNAAVIARETDPLYFGRVMSLTFLAFGAFGLVGLPVGLLADALGERSALAAMAALVGATSLLLTVRLAAQPASPPPRASGDRAV